MTDYNAPRIGVDAESKKAGMTLDEIANFVSRAFSAGTPADTPVRAVLGIRGQVQQLETRPDKRVSRPAPGHGPAGEPA